jgi:molybdopterin-guanine dinucleotide biosynthesis protein A
LRFGGIVLCGGKSSRMGAAKAMLPFGPERMLARVVRLLAMAVDPIVVVAATNQELPELPASVLVVRDRRESRGPLEGLSAGLHALAGLCEGAYVTSCDVPLLAPVFVLRMIELLSDHSIVVPRVGGHDHPLAAVYRASVLPRIEALLAQDRLRVKTLFEQVDTRFVLPEELSEVDPNFGTLMNLNQPEDYLSALAKAGFEAPPEFLRTLDR